MIKSFSLLPVIGLVVITLSASQSFSEIIKLNFEGVNSTWPSSGHAFVQDFYNGGFSSDGTTGVDYGVSFSANARALCLNTRDLWCSNASRGGLGDPTSQLGGLSFASGSVGYVNVVDGFDTGVSFFYSAPFNPGTVSVFDGLNGTGNLLASYDLGYTRSDDRICDEYGSDGVFCPFDPVSISFSGMARSISFEGDMDQMVFDDITLGSVSAVPLPAAIWFFASAITGLYGCSRLSRG